MSKPTTRIILVVNQKGGVGKTVAAQVTTEYLRALGSHSVAAFDADGGVGGLVASLGTKDAEGFPEEVQDPLVGVGYFDIRSSEERGQVVNCMSVGSDIIVVDMAGGSLSDLTEVADGGDGVDTLLRGYAEYGYRVTLMHVISGLLPATNSVGAYLEIFGDRVDHVVVKNLSCVGKDKVFPFWSGFIDGEGNQVGGTIRQKLLAVSGVEVEMPAIPQSTFAKVNALAIPYAAAKEDKRLQIVERMHVDKFRQDFSKSIKAAEKFLLPPA